MGFRKVIINKEYLHIINWKEIKEVM